MSGQGIPETTMPGPGGPYPGAVLRWTRATAVGWVLGFVLLIVLSLLGDVIGTELQFPVGVGMGAGVGFMQTRVLGAWLPPSRRWLWTSILGMGLPFLLWDLGTLLGRDAVFSLPLCVLAGGLLIGILQWPLLRARYRNASLWIPALVVGWGVPAGAIFLGDSDLPPGPWALAAAIVLGGVVLGAVSGRTLLWMARR